MTRQNINVGSSANDGTGDTLRSAGTKINQNFTLSQLDTTYHTLRQVITPNSFTFDDSSIRDSDENASPDFSITLETMDNEIFTRRVTDSAF